MKTATTYFAVSLLVPVVLSGRWNLELHHPKHPVVLNNYWESKYPAVPKGPELGQSNYPVVLKDLDRKKYHVYSPAHTVKSALVSSPSVLHDHQYPAVLKGPEPPAVLEDHRKSKFFGVGLVRFENSVCTSATNNLGTCYTRRQCNSVDGVASGTCASNIGVCCVVTRNCGETTTWNNTYFTNDDFPNPTTAGTSCTLTVQKCNNDICQIRIDFLSLNLAQPDPTGVCDTDALTITGGAAPVPIICGENTGQHVYVDFNGNNTIQITVMTSSTDTVGRIWDFLITQIACDCPTRAPIGCLMYYTALSGTVNSFNYGTAANEIDPNTGLPGTRELVNENYGVCIAMSPGYCSIQWSAATGTSFVVSGDLGALGMVSLTGSDCSSDFVVIPDPTYVNGTAVNSDRFCGTAFPTVVSSSKPFVLTVVTNGNEINDTQNRGFSLNYQQVRCTLTTFT